MPIVGYANVGALTTTPASNNLYDLGSTAFAWRTEYLATSLVLIQSGGNYTISPANPAANRAITLPDPGAAANLCMDQGNYTIAGTWTFSVAPVLSGPLALTGGGTAASLAASNGGIVYSGAAAFAVLAGTATAGQMLRSGASAAPAWSTATFPAVATGTGTLLRADGTNWVASTLTVPDTAAISTVLYASAANVISALATANNGVLITGGTGVPSISSTLPSGIILVAPALGTPASGVLTNATGLPAAAVVAGTFAAGMTFGTVTLGGVVSGGGQQVNNVIIGTVTPLPGSFTTLTLTGATVTASTVAVTWAMKSATSNALLFTDGTNNWFAITTSTAPGGGGTRAFTFSSQGVTTPSADPIRQMAYWGTWTLTLTGGTAVTVLSGLNNYFDIQTVTDTTAVTVTTASTIYIAGVPVAAGSVTITNTIALDIGGAGIGLWLEGGRLQIGGAVGVTANQFFTGTQGAASTAMFIGNGQITVVSDVRVKSNIQPWAGDALAMIRQFQVVEFDMDDRYKPFGGVYDGRYIGLTAQDMYQVAPWTVNTQGGKDCWECRAGLRCEDHLAWQVRQELLTGVIVRGIQELEAENTELRHRVAVLEGKN